MKKYLLTLGLVAFLMTSCCDKQEEKATCEHNCKDKKEQCDKHHHECDHHGEMPGMCPEMMACQDGLINALANWEDLDEEQRAEAINMAKKIQEMKANMPKPECGKDGKHEGCKHEEGHKCEGNHEGCNHQHEGCEKDKKNCAQCHENEVKGECPHQHDGCQHQHEGCKHGEK